MALDDQPLPLYASTQNRREWIHVLDHCTAIDAVLAQGVVGETYHVGTGVEKSIEEIADSVLAALGKPAGLKTIVPDRPGHDRRYLLDSSRIRRELGLGAGDRVRARARRDRRLVRGAPRVVGTAPRAGTGRGNVGLEVAPGSRMRVFITGAGGQVGRELVDAFVGHDVVAADHATLDVGDRDAVVQAIAASAPDAVVHAAAWTAVDACEGDPDRAFRDNALATRYVAEAASRVDAGLCYLSTDYVFDGTKADPYDEWDAPNPTSVYGRSKLGGEEELDPGDTIVRTSWVCGFHGGNMVKTILRLASEHDQLSFVDDQRGHPTFAADLARTVRTLVLEQRPGLFHVTNQGAVSWFEFARAVLSAAGLDPNRVDPITTAELDPPRPAPRPANSVLDNAALRLGGLDLLPHYRETLDPLVARLLS